MAERLDFLQRRPWREGHLPPDAVGVPTMLSKDERKLLYILARDYASDDAAIVDAGCFLGGSTVALLAGLRDRSRPWRGPPLASYDLFRVEAYTIRKFFSDRRRLRVGDSFRPSFDANVAGFDVPHVVHEGDITELGWDGGPIDVLFLDVLKTWNVNDAVLRDFFPHLRPGRSVIVHQDYGSGWVPWIPITVELMGESLRLIDSMEWGSHIFFVAGEVDSELMGRGVRSLSAAEKFELIDRAIARASGWVRGMLETSRTELIWENEGVNLALADLERVATSYRDEPAVASFVEYLEEAIATGGNFEASAKVAGRARRFAHAGKRLASVLLRG